MENNDQAVDLLVENIARQLCAGIVAQAHPQTVKSLFGGRSEEVACLPLKSTATCSIQAVDAFHALIGMRECVDRAPTCVSIRVCIHVCFIHLYMYMSLQSLIDVKLLPIGRSEFSGHTRHAV